MEYQINIVTLGVNEPVSLADWYKEKFGWTNKMNNDGSVLIQSGKLALVLAPIDKLAKELCLWQDEQRSKGFALTLGLESEKEVDRLFAELRVKAVLIIKAPHRLTGGGYGGYIADPEDNFWQLAYFPFIETPKTRNTVITDSICYS